MKYNIALFFLLVFSIQFVTAQSSLQYVESSESDPEATAVLKKLKEKYDAFQAIEAEFALTIEFPEELPEVQQGKMVQMGDKYMLSLAGQEIYCDGQTLWLYLKQNEEVQINDVEEEGDFEMLSPKDLLRIYERDDFVYVLGNAYTEGTKAYQEIEFKPLDQESEYTKMRLTINKQSNELASIKVFSKDGSRYVLELKQLTVNGNYPASFFVFDHSKYPDVYVEDLRMD